MGRSYLSLRLSDFNFDYNFKVDYKSSIVLIESQGDSPFHNLVIGIMKGGVEDGIAVGFYFGFSY